MAPHSAIQKSKTLDYYLCLIFIVAPLRAIVFASPIAFVSLLANQSSLLGTPWSLWIAIPLILLSGAETIFLIYYLHSKKACEPLHPNPPQIIQAHANRIERMDSALAFFEKMLFHVDDIPTFIEGHFYGIPFENISRNDLCRWAAFVFYSKSIEQVTDNEMNEISIMVSSIYEKSNRKEPLVSDSRLPLPYLQPNLEPFQATARPLLVYLATITLNGITSLWLKLCGFRKYQATIEISYWHRPAIDDETDVPLAFLHGVGIGLTTYIPLLWNLFRHQKNRQIFLLDMPYVAMQLSDAVPEKNETLYAIERMLAHHNISNRVHWMGHSFGSIVMSWLCQEKPEWVHYLTFFDPIIFALWQHDGIYNIMYREPSTGFDLVLWYFGSQEIGIARTMRRHLCWYESVLFPENLPRHPETNQVLASIFLSEKDCIIDAPAVHRHLQRPVKNTSIYLHTMMWPGITHGEMILYPSAHHDVFSTIKKIK